MADTVKREMRWFLPGVVPPETHAWFESLASDHAVAAYPREDVYLIVPARDDLGPKVREGRFEIKIRDAQLDTPVVAAEHVIGIAEDWSKHKWRCSEEVRGLANVFDKGPRLRVAKYRRQRKFKIVDDRLDPVKLKSRHDVVFLVELTELHTHFLDKKKTGSEPARGWTVACEAVAPAEIVAHALELGATEIFANYNGPPLTPDMSFGYPHYAAEIANSQPQ
ncbi:MAG: hypothetical protein V3T86_04690 [Planctomycetota bacterium]